MFFKFSILASDLPDPQISDPDLFKIQLVLTLKKKETSQPMLYQRKVLIMLCIKVHKKLRFLF